MKNFLKIIAKTINKNFKINSENNSNAVQNNLDSMHEGNLKSLRKLHLTEKFFDFLISLSIALIFLEVILFSTGITFQGPAFEKQIGFLMWTFIALIAWIVKSAIKGEIKIRRTPLDIPIAIFWLTCFISTIFSIDRWQSLWGFFGNPTHGLVNITASIVFYYIIMSNFNIRRLRVALGTFIFSGSILITLEILKINKILNVQNSYFIEAHHWAGHFIENPIGSTTGIAIFTSIFLIILVTVFVKIKSIEMAKFRKIFLESVFLIMIGASLYLLLALYYFVPWLGILIGMGFFITYILAGIVKMKKRVMNLPMFVFWAVLFAMLLGNVFAAKFKISSMQYPAEASINYKMSWQIARETIMKHSFFLGSGPATYGYDFSLYKPKEFNLNTLYSLRFNEGSGLFWELIPTLGILGTFYCGLLIVSFLNTGLYLLGRKSDKNKIYSLGLMAVSISIFIDSLFVRLGASMTILGIIFAIFAFGIFLLEDNTEEKYFKFVLRTSPKYSLVSAFVLLTAVAGAIFLCVFVLKIFVADIFAGMANKQKGEISIKMIEKAISFNDKEGRYYTFEGQQYMVLANDEFIKGEQANLDLIKEYLDKATEISLKGKELMPNDIVAAETLAQIYENKLLYFSQFSEQTILAYKEAIKLEPHNPIYFLKIGKIVVMQAAAEKDEAAKKNLMKEAKNWFQKAVDQKEDLAEAQYQLGLVQQSLEDLGGAITSFQKAIKNERSNGNYFLALANAYQLRGSEDDYNIAEEIYKNIILVQDDNLETHFSLGLLYEKMKRFQDAAEQYRKVSDLLNPENKNSKAQIEKMIKNASNGIENTAENLKSAPVSEESNSQSIPAAPSTDASANPSQ